MATRTATMSLGETGKRLVRRARPFTAFQAARLPRRFAGTSDLVVVGRIGLDERKR
jgi:hypothetical protein